MKIYQMINKNSDKTSKKKGLINVTAKYFLLPTKYLHHTSA